MFEGKRIAVVMPSYNEEALILKALSDVPSVVDRIYVVDDASEDETIQVVLSSQDSRVKLLVHQRNEGVGASIRDGYLQALKEGFDIALVMAADAQMDPKDLMSLIKPLLLNEADYVKGNRLASKSLRKSMPFLRLIGNHFLSWLTRMMLQNQIEDSQCGYTALALKQSFHLPLHQLWARYGYPNDLIAMLQSKKMRIKDVPIRALYGSEKSGIHFYHAFFVIPYVIVRARIKYLKRRSKISFRFKVFSR